MENDQPSGSTNEPLTPKYKNNQKNCFTQTKEDVDSHTKTEVDDNKQNESEGDSEEQNSVTCVHCIFDKELDKRNYYFGNLLIGELQFLPPCMRSKAYMEILKYIDSLKQKHRDEHSYKKQD